MKKTIFSKILAFLKTSKEEVKLDADGNPVFTAEQTEKLKGIFGETYEKVLLAVNNELAAENNSNAELEAVRQELVLQHPEANTNSENETESTTDDPDLVAQIQAMKKLQEDQRQKIEALEKEPEKTTIETITAKTAKIAYNNAVSTNKHVYGIEHEFFARSNWWNEVSATRKPAEIITQDMDENIKKAFGKYASDVAARFNTLQKEGKLSEIKSGSIDYTDLETQWGAAHYIRRQDALISYLMALPSVTSIFPVRYGVQDKEEMTNSFFDDFSQAYQSGEVFKGAYKVQPEIAKIDRMMFKHQFTDLKQLEKEHIGYLNREGSDPMKWTLIEWLMLQTTQKLLIEQNERRVVGHFVTPISDEASHHLLGSDGVLTRIQSYVDSYKILVFSDKNTYTKSTILAYVEDFVDQVNIILASMEGWKLYINAKHIPWYKANFRDTYGTDADFSGSKLKAIDYSLDNFVPVPNMATTDYRMWLTLPGNIELLEPKAGEMFGIYFERRLEKLIAASWWGEGSAAYRSGQEFTTKALLVTNNYKNQFIFTNDPYTALADGATTADASLNTFFQTVSNTSGTPFTDFTGAKEGRVYRLTLGHTNNATTIAKSGKFSEISAAWTPTAVGDYLEVWYDESASKFIEVARRVT